MGFPCGSAGKESACNVGDLGSVPGLARSPGEGKGYPLQCSGLENSMDSPWGHKESDTTEPAPPLNSYYYYYSSLLPWVCVQTPVRFLVRKIHWRRDRLPTPVSLGFPYGSASKESACNTGDLDLIPGLERSSGEGNGYPLQYSGLKNSMDSPWGHKE